MKRLSRAVVLNVAGIGIALAALVWILLGSSAIGTTPLVRIGTWSPLSAGSHAP